MQPKPFNSPEQPYNTPQHPSNMKPQPYNTPPQPVPFQFQRVDHSPIQRASKYILTRTPTGTRVQPMRSSKLIKTKFASRSYANKETSIIVLTSLAYNITFLFIKLLNL